MHTLTNKTSDKQRTNNSMDDNYVSKSSRTIVHAKLKMSQPGDSDEFEADAVANSIINGGKICRSISNGTAGCGIAVSHSMETMLSQTQGGGRTMPDGLRNMMERGFDRDFSSVRLHTDNQAEEMSDKINAKAFTLGNDIYFGKNQYSSSTTSGLQLIAHELTHVAQGSGKVCRDAGDTQNTDRTRTDKIKDHDWINNHVLGLDAQNQLYSNYNIEDKNRLITVVIYTNETTACQMEVEEPLYISGIERRQTTSPTTTNSTQKNKRPDKCPLEEKDISRERGLTGLLLNNNEGSRIYMIQDSAQWIVDLHEIVSRYGMLENVIFRGHGNYNRVNINKSLRTMDRVLALGRAINTLFLETDKLCDKRVKHSILFSECLTQGLPGNATDSICNRMLSKMDPKLDVCVMGNQARVRTESVQYYRDDEGYLKFMNLDDPSAPKEATRLTDNITCNESSEPMNTYTGCEINGVIMGLISQIEWNEKEVNTSKYMNITNQEDDSHKPKEEELKKVSYLIRKESNNERQEENVQHCDRISTNNLEEKQIEIKTSDVIRLINDINGTMESKRILLIFLYLGEIYSPIYYSREVTVDELFQTALMNVDCFTNIGFPRTCKKAN